MFSMFIFFFFSSRRRHTRSLRDWSSDVCSSDLGIVPPPGVGRFARLVVIENRSGRVFVGDLPSKIGRASCRERVEVSVVAGSLNKIEGVRVGLCIDVGDM